ncbi:MAG: hypothetical protein LBF66_03515 [Holosporales bacterium]|jgi:putative ABC transport system permease protein|nr:hypothetical protein [Holosporales bacterium]
MAWANEISSCIALGLLQGILGTALFLTLRILNFTDLTCEGSFVFGACVSSMLLGRGYGVCVSVATAFAAGGVAGLCTGVLNIVFKVKDILAGILVAFMLYSINLRIMGVPNITLPENVAIGGVYLFGFGIVCILGYLLTTDWGLAFRSVGQNQALAKTTGVSVKKMTFIGLALSNALIGLSGSLFSINQGFCDIGSGTGLLIVGLASVIIGEKVLPFRSFYLKILGCFFGSVLYRFFICLALNLDSSQLKPSDVNIVTGLLILAFMSSKITFRRRLTCPSS